MKRIIAIMLCLSLALCVFASCGNKTENTNGNIKETVAPGENGSAQNSAQNDEDSSENKTDNSKEDTEMSNPQVKFKMENAGEFVVELYPEYAPKTVENFLKLVNEGFYNGLTFHRVVRGFMAQGGCPDGTGMGGSKETIKGEFASNGFSQNTLSHTRGVISMARSAMNDSASSQFFICYSDGCAALDGDYAAFGKVIKGMEVVDAFCDNEMVYNTMGEKASPVNPIYIDTVTEIK